MTAPGISARRGSALVETTIVLPLFVLIWMNAVNFGTYMFDWITINDAARAAAEFQVYNGIVVASNGDPPSSTAVTAVVTANVASLPNSGSVAVTICPVFNGTSSCTPVPANDPEPTRYRVWYVTVAYTYSPFFPAFTLPVLNIPLTIPASTIQQTVVMRGMQ